MTINVSTNQVIHICIVFKETLLIASRPPQWDASSALSRQRYHTLYGEHFGDKNFSVF
jgi:hypothetical protein